MCRNWILPWSDKSKYRSEILVYLWGENRKLWDCLRWVEYYYILEYCYVVQIVKYLHENNVSAIVLLIEDIVQGNECK